MRYSNRIIYRQRDREVGMKIWITGIAGFLGSRLARELMEQGHVVAGNDNYVCGNNHVGALVYRADCCDNNSMRTAFALFQPEVLVHAAATAHEGLSNFSPAFITRNIYEASVSTFSAAIATGVKRIVYMSSMSRYGNGSWGGVIHDRDRSLGDIYGPPFKEEYRPNPVDPYAVAKVAAEQTLRILAETHGIDYSIAVPHNIIGIGQRYVDPFRNVASIMMNRCLQGKAPVVYGDGQQTRCFSPVADCIPSLIKMINGEANGEVVNIGPDSDEITVLELAQKIVKLTGFAGEIIHMPDRPNEVKHAFCSSDKARKILGYKPQQSIDDCLAEMVAAMKAEPFVYDFPIEIEKGCPEVWLKRMM